MYRIGLVARIGEERVKHLESIANDNRVKKYTDEELELIKTKYKL